MADSPSTLRRAYDLQLVDVETGIGVPIGRLTVDVPVVMRTEDADGVTVTAGSFDADLVAGLRQAADELEARHR